MRIYRDPLPIPHTAGGKEKEREKDAKDDVPLILLFASYDVTTLDGSHAAVTPSDYAGAATRLVGAASAITPPQAPPSSSTGPPPPGPPPPLDAVGHDEVYAWNVHLEGLALLDKRRNLSRPSSGSGGSASATTTTTAAGGVGLANPTGANHCFLNVIMQSIFHMPGVVETLKGYTKGGVSASAGKLIRMYANIVATPPSLC